MERPPCKQCTERESAKQRTICNTCRSRNYSAKHPLLKMFLDKKADAKKRNLTFELSFEYFKQLAEKHDLLNNRGRGKDSLTVDRSVNEGGYTNDNVSIMTKSENCKKYWQGLRGNYINEQGNLVPIGAHPF